MFFDPSSFDPSSFDPGLFDPGSFDLMSVNQFQYPVCKACILFKIW